VSAPDEPPPPPPPSKCPSCGAKTTAGQHVCVECGHDLTRTYRRPPYTRLWIAAGVVAVLAIGIGAGFAIGSSTNDKQKKEARAVSITNGVPAATAVPPQALHQPTAPVTPIPTAPAPTTPPPTSAPPPTTPSPAITGGVATWPSGKTAYTVILVSSKNRRQAYAKAREARTRGIDAGVLHSNGYSALKPGYWLVFAGQYKTVTEARLRLGDYASKGFPGSYPRRIKK
jgi:type IV secretory pathway VirB10-like protein